MSLQAHLKYLKYVLKHKHYTAVEASKLRVPIRGVLHDLSKFAPSEWFAYAAHFYDHAKDVRVLFDRAWLNHIHRNPHHWEYWVIPQGPADWQCLPIPEKYIREMLADWRGVARTKGYDSIRTWYENNCQRILMHEDSRKLLLSLMSPHERPREKKQEKKSDKPRRFHRSREARNISKNGRVIEARDLRAGAPNDSI